MPSEHFPEPPSLRLAPGAQVGCWRVVARQGHGGCGIVYRALRVGQEHAGPVALKLARYPWDRRFAREAELLSRIHHPSVPRLYDQGVWRLATGAEHPFLVMEWVEGTPLYEWAAAQAPSPEQQLRLVAQLARALAATHAAQALHRDVKGDNVRVHHLDGRAVLMDFGSGHYEGASRLTWGSLPPGTDAYRSPEAWRFHYNAAAGSEACFEATAADDLYSLGVTVYRLVTGEYPPGPRTRRDAAGAWQLVGEDPRPYLEHHPQVHPVLRERLPRLLSLAPEERGTAVELAEALEGAAARAVAPAPAVTASLMTEPPAEALCASEQAVRPAPVRTRSSWRALAAVGLSGLCLCALQALLRQPEEALGGGLEACASGVPDPEPVAVGDEASRQLPASAHPPAEPEAVAQEPLPKPHPRQVRPDEKGKCPGRTQVALNEACWVEFPSMKAEACAENGYAYYKGRCYAPTVEAPEKPRPTSTPADRR
jgi:predicted Ser/Thr protein kinase